MKLTCLGTGSKQGNCYLLGNDDEVLILDCGVGIKQIKMGLGWDISNVVGCCVTHSHLDHSSSMEEISDTGIRICAPYIINNGISGMAEQLHVTYGNFEVNAFALTDTQGHFKHTNTDGSECPCYGFLISHPDMGRLLYITDTELVKWRFEDINHILISCNYQKKYIIEDGLAKRNHVFRGHMELDTVKCFVGANKSDSLKTVILCHLSTENANADEMKAEVEKVVDCPVYVAEKGLEIEVNDNDCPF